MNWYEYEIMDKTITLTRPGEGVNIRDCVFYNCHFEINKPSFFYLTGNIYIDCTFNLDLSSCKKDIHIDFDTIIEYPEVKEYLDKLIPSKCPQNEVIYGYKILYNEFHDLDFLVKLQIDAETPRVNNGVCEKCRAEKAKVISIYTISQYKIHGLRRCKSVYHKCSHSRGQNIEYTVGHNVYANLWDSNRFNVCTNGIHFYLDPITALHTQWGCGKEVAKEIVSKINKIDPDFYEEKGNSLNERPEGANE